MSGTSSSLILISFSSNWNHQQFSGSELNVKKNWNWRVLTKSMSHPTLVISIVLVGSLCSEPVMGG